MGKGTSPPRLVAHPLSSSSCSSPTFPSSSPPAYPHPPAEASQPLSLQQQLDILIGVARGLEYLHSFKIVHRDIKPANILIGDDMQAKIADFGVARMVEGTTVGKTQHAGTPGYMDPAYIKTHRATTASDVYSFGVLMLVVLSGRPDPTDCDGNGQHILQWASECFASGNSASLKDPTMDAPGDAVLRVAELAVSCTVDRTASRPSMAHIATQLQAVREEVAGREELREALKVDTEVQEMREDPPGDLDEELKEIGVILSGRLPGQDRAECSAREPLMDSSAPARSPDLQNSSSLALHRSSSDVACEISSLSSG
ncbi:unnamed protein product [Closterium sp. NIES-65]|nr:unnamed protein product [Closterium sp. NIES-65]